jgi:hypothetical protein
MKAICIDGNPKGQSSIHLPEGIPLDVYETLIDPNYYLVPGYEVCPDSDDIIIWHKRRFIFTSNIDELELVNSKEEVV